MVRKSETLLASDDATCNVKKLQGVIYWGLRRPTDVLLLFVFFQLEGCYTLMRNVELIITQVLRCTKIKMLFSVTVNISINN